MFVYDLCFRYYNLEHDAFQKVCLKDMEFPTPVWKGQTLYVPESQEVILAEVYDVNQIPGNANADPRSVIKGRSPYESVSDQRSLMQIVNDYVRDYATKRNPPTPSASSPAP